MAPNKKLGKGLSSLLGNKSDLGFDKKSENGLLLVPIENIFRDENQPRKEFDKEKIEELAQSIHKNGLIQPLILTKKADDHYMLVAGERRWRAAQIANLKMIPSLLLPEDLDKDEISLIENIQREDLNPIEEANGYQNLVDSFSYTQEDLAKAVGKSRPHVANMMRLLNLPPTLRTYVAEGRLSAGHARALLVAKDPEKLAELVVQRGLNVRQTERLVQEGGMQAPRKPSSRDPNVVSAEKDLSDALGLKAALQPVGKRGGRLVLHYKDYDQLEFLISRLTKRPHQYT